MQGWAQVALGQDEAGMAQIRCGLAALRATGAALRLPYYLALLAEALAHSKGESWTGVELHRLKGELLLAQEGTKQRWLEAEECFHQALAIARRQQAKSWELRAASSLSRLWQQQGKRDIARRLLEPIYDWFTEGFDTTDLQEAKALLEEWS